MPIQIEQLADVFVDVADTLVADFDLLDFLQSLARHATTLSGAAAAGVMLRDRDETLHHVGASSEDARLLELFQIQNAEGPCLDAYVTGEMVAVPDLSAAASRWPLFVPRAISAGMVSVYAFPMRLREQVLGGLNVFRTEASEVTSDEVRVLQALADMATIALIQEQAIARAEVVTQQLQVALDSRIVVEQAKGAVARTFGISVDEAFELIRSHARQERRRLTEVATDLVTNPEAIRRLSR